jgi:hypothetical protein
MRECTTTAINVTVPPVPPSARSLYCSKRADVRHSSERDLSQPRLGGHHRRGTPKVHRSGTLRGVDRQTAEHWQRDGFVDIGD